MKAGHLIAAAALLLAAALAPTASMAQTRLGVVSYWGTDTSEYGKIPPGSLAILNPSSGIFLQQGQGTTIVPFVKTYRDVVSKAAKRDIAMLGYVPTGYFHHDCNQYGKCQTWARIEGQVKAYFDNVPELAGIFFDEAAPSDWSCEAYLAEYQTLRDLVHKFKPDARIAFNPGFADMCAVDASQPGETLVLFETDGAGYLDQADKIRAATLAARQRGVLSWHVINTVPKKAEMQTVVAAGLSYAPDYLYVVDVSGDWQAGYNTYGALPRYWRDEVRAILPDANQGAQ